MSGFVGIAHRDRAPLDTVLLERMTESMAFRGPDGRQTWIGEGVGLGAALHRSTYEAAREVQPATLESDVWIVADARLDCRGELIADLRSRGRRPSLECPDSELILHAYAVWGERCVDHLSGDFAFGIWDGRRERLFCARDHFGVAQFFYAQVGDTLLIGNTLQALLLFPGLSSALDEQALADAALFNFFLEPEATAYLAIRRLTQGHTLTWGDAGLRVERYWSPPVSLPSLRCRTDDEYIERFRVEFDRAVADRLRIDAVGCQLSGGMDSTSIAATANSLLAAKGIRAGVRTYTIVYNHLLNEDEGMYAEEVAAHCGFPLEKIVAEEHLNTTLSDEPDWLPAEPGLIYSPAEREIVSRVSQFARAHLVGLGGDPALHCAPFSLNGAWAAIGQGEWRWPLKCARRAWRVRSRGDALPPLPAWVHPRLAGRFDLQSRIERVRRPLLSHRSGMVGAPLWRAFFALSDPGSSGIPVRVRFPFFDRKLFELILALPPAPWCEHKLILRAAMAGRLPATVLARPKTPLPGNPLHLLHQVSGVPSWMREVLATPEMRDILDTQWLEQVERMPPAQQATVWHKSRPPIDLAFWLRHHRSATLRA